MNPINQSNPRYSHQLSSSSGSRTEGPATPSFSHLLPKPPSQPQQQQQLPRGKGFPHKSNDKWKRTSLRTTQRLLQTLDGFIYQVQFKRAAYYFILSFTAPKEILIGDYVVVEGDRGENIGLLLAKIPVERFNEELECHQNSHPGDNKGKGGGEAIERRNETRGGIGRGGGMREKTNRFAYRQTDVKYLFRKATEAERLSLVLKAADEENALQDIRERVSSMKLPMEVIDAEYQYDRHKLTFYFQSTHRIDFRELTNELYSKYKARIWLQQINPYPEAIAQIPMNGGAKEGEEESFPCMILSSPRMEKDEETMKYFGTEK